MTWRTRSLKVPALVATTLGLVVLTSCGTGSRSASPDAAPALPHVASHAVAGHCDGRIGADSVDDDVTVPDGATCELLGTTVEGNVSIGHGARLYARGVDVDGDIEGERTALVELSAESNVGGNVQLESGATAIVRDSHIDGDLSWEDQHGHLLAEHTSVSGNLEADGNTGGLSLSDNKIGGDLSCQENSPTPNGGGNTVSGDHEDQCRGL